MAGIAAKAECPLWVDIVAKVENRTTLKISRKWCFRQISPTLGEQDIAAAASNIFASRLWLTIVIAYDDGEAQLHHSRYRLVYNFETGTLEPAKEKAVWFD